MRRILSVFLIILLIITMLVSCERDGDDTDATATQHVHIFSRANCISPKTCECGATEGKPTNVHHFEGGSCTVCGIGEDFMSAFARILTDSETGAVREGFFVSRDGGTVKHITAYVDPTLSGAVHYRTAIKITAEAIESGTFEWKLIRGESDQNSQLWGAIDAKTFSVNAELELWENDGFTESEVAVYLPQIAAEIDRILTDLIPEAMLGNDSGMTVADLGFANYK